MIGAFKKKTIGLKNVIEAVSVSHKLVIYRVFLREADTGVL